MEDFSERLRLCMEAKGASQKSFADACGLSQASVSRYLAAQGLPKAMELFAMSKYFGVSMEWLLVGDDAREVAGLVEEEEGVRYSAKRKADLRTVADQLEEIVAKIQSLEGP